jgi:hypothetical protein
MNRLPQVVSLTLCDRIGIDPGGAGISYIGVFNAKGFSQFPAPPTDFIVCTALYDGHGEGTLEMMIEWLEGERPIFRHRRWIVIAGRQYTLNIQLPIQHIRFPAAGRYEIRLRLDDQLLASRRLDIYRS